MADASYQPGVYREQGGNRMVVKSGASLDVESSGEIDVESGGALKIAGTDVASEVGALSGIEATATEINRSSDLGVIRVERTTSGAVSAGASHVELNHATVAIAATISNTTNHKFHPFTVKNTSASGTEAHTLTLTAGTFNGTNTIATLNAPGEALTVIFDNAGNGHVLANVGSVALSGP